MPWYSVKVTDVDGKVSVPRVFADHLFTAKLKAWALKMQHPTIREVKVTQDPEWPRDKPKA